MAGLVTLPLEESPRTPGSVEATDSSTNGGNSMPMGDKGDYQFINRNGQMIGAIFPTAAGAKADESPHWRYYFRVPSISKAKETAEQKGGRIVFGPMEVPGGDHVIIGTDPQGAEFALVGGQ